jgi:hypothetical protein
VVDPVEEVRDVAGIGIGLIERGRARIALAFRH